MPICILTGVSITSDNDSDAHVIPSALGGRLRPRGLLTIAANTFLNDRLDAPLIRALTPFMSLVDGKRDHGENQPIVLKAADGTAYRVSPDGPMTLDRPGYKETPTEGGVLLNLQARTMTEARHLVNRARSAHPQIDVEVPSCFQSCSYHCFYHRFSDWATSLWTGLERAQHL